MIWFAISGRFRLMLGMVEIQILRQVVKNMALVFHPGLWAGTQQALVLYL